MNKKAVIPSDPAILPSIDARSIPGNRRKVKFLPEYANGGRGPPIGDNNVKEVWFAGSHSDMYVTFTMDACLY